MASFRAKNSPFKVQNLESSDLSSNAAPPWLSAIKILSTRLVSEIEKSAWTLEDKSPLASCVFQIIPVIIVTTIRTMSILRFDFIVLNFNRYYLIVGDIMIHKRLNDV